MNKSYTLHAAITVTASSFSEYLKKIKQVERSIQHGEGSGSNPKKISIEWMDSKREPTVTAG